MVAVAKPYSAICVQEHIGARVVIESRGHETPCWIWQSGINGAGYPTGRPSGCSHGGMHRISYEAFVGPIPQGLVIDHLCSVRACVNPAHLEAITQSENVRRSAARTHCRRGHEFTAENTIGAEIKGNRRCRRCFEIWADRKAAARETQGGGPSIGAGGGSRKQMAFAQRHGEGS